METETQTEEVTPLQEEQAAEPKRYTDAESFIREINCEPDPELHPIQTSRGEFLARKLGMADSTAVMVGKWRDVPSESDEKQARREFDLLATTDQLVVQTIAMCIVKPDGSNFFKLGNVTYMYSSPKQAKFADFLQELYQGCIEYNPRIDPKNPDALQKIFGLR